jgi:hypothetical protein
MARRRSGVLPWLVVLVLVTGLLTAGLVVGDRWARATVEQRVAEQLQVSLGTPERPRVAIAGFPFLMQVLNRDVRAVQVGADDLGKGNDALLPVHHGDFTVTDVTSKDWYRTMTAGHIEGVALLSYDDLAKLANVPISYVSDGRVEIDVTAQVLGASIHAKITGKPRLEPNQQAITLADPKITVAEFNLPDLTAQALLRALVKPIPLTGIPLGLKLTSVGAEGDGLHLVVAGDDVALR